MYVCPDAFTRRSQGVRRDPGLIESLLGNVGLVKREVFSAEELDAQDLGVGNLFIQSSGSLVNAAQSRNRITGTHPFYPVQVLVRGQNRLDRHPISDLLTWSRDGTCPVFLE